MKKVASLLLAVLMVCTMIPLSALPAFAEDTGGFTWPFGKGAGTAENPYTISSYNQLKRLADDVNGGADVTGIYFKLTQSTAFNLFTPIGTTDHPFKGHFDGGGNIVLIRMDKPDKNYLGLFGCAEGAEINNVYWQGNIAGHNYIGGICGYCKDTTITNCGYKTIGNIDGSVTGSGSTDGKSCYIGGICGCMINGTISDCSMEGSVINNSTEDNEQAYTGGICGYIEGDVSNCTCAGSITLDKNFNQHNAGGICGYLKGDIENCSNSAEVFAAIRKPDGTLKDSMSTAIGGICGYLMGGASVNCINSGAVTGGVAVGGICGVVDQGYILNATNKGVVTTFSINGGGICGMLLTSSISDGGIFNCVNKADFQILDGATQCGGIAGDCAFQIVNCISTGGPAILGSSTSYEGGIVGFITNPEDLHHSYCNGDYSLFINELSSGAVGEAMNAWMPMRDLLRSTEQLKSPDMLVEFNEYAREVEKEIPQLHLLEWVKDEDGFPCLDYPTVNDIDGPVKPFTPGEQLPPVILSGENSKWKKGSKDGVVVAASGAYDKLSAVYMDGEPVDESCLDVFPTAIAVDSEETSNGFAHSVIAYLGGDSAASRIVEPERTILFRVPWVDDEAAGGTHSDRGRQLAIILDDDSKEANPALIGKTVLLVDFPEDAALSGGVGIRVRGGSTLDTSNDPLIVTDGSPSGSATIRIRGIGTINDNDPLYIIDGTPTTAGLHVLSYSGYDPTLKSRTAVTEDAGNGTSIILFLGVLAELPTDGESNVLDVSAFTGIALKPEYLETLSVGSHTLKLVYADGAEVSTNIEITAQTDTPTSPQTGDNSHMALWLMLLALSSTGLCACLVLGKKRKNEQ